MKKDFLFVLVQFGLFALYFMNWGVLEFSVPVYLRYLASAGVVLGIIIVLLGILNLSDNLSPFPSPKKNSILIQNGIYKYVRHPIYLGVLCSMYTYSIYVGSIDKLIITLVLNVVFYFKSSFEEQMLVARYGAYGEYQKTAGRFWPKFGPKKGE